MANAKKLISVGDLFSKSWSIYKKIWSTLFIISAITTIIWKLWQLYIVPALLTISGVTSFTAGLVSQNLASALGVGLIGVAILLLSGIVIFEIGFLGSAAIIVALQLHLDGKHPTIGAIFDKARTLLLPLTIVSLLVSCIEIVGLIFFIVPGLILIFLLTFCNFIVVIEKKTGFAVLQRSMSLVKNHFWDILVRYLAIGTIGFLINIILGRAVWFQFVSQTLILPFTVIYHYILYKDVAEN